MQGSAYLILREHGKEIIGKYTSSKFKKEDFIASDTWLILFMDELLHVNLFQQSKKLTVFSRKVAALPFVFGLTEGWS